MNTLIFITSLLFCGLAWVKISKNKTSILQGGIKILQSISLGQKERLVMIEYNAQKYLLGVTAGGITMLTPVELSKKEAVMSQPAFQEWLDNAKENTAV